MYYAAFLLRLPTPMAATTTRPMTTATWPLKVGPVPEDARPGLWQRGGPLPCPSTATVESLLPLPERMSCRRGSRPA